MGRRRVKHRRSRKKRDKGESPIPSPKTPLRQSHTGGVIKLDGEVIKPLLGYPSPNALEPVKTMEFEAIKALDDLSHIPKDVEKIEVEGIPHLKRENYQVLDDEDYRELRKEDLISIERALREAHKRGWILNDQIQLGISDEHYEYVIYDWSNASHPDNMTRRKWVDEVAINHLWKKAGYNDFIKAKKWASDERTKIRLESQFELKPNYSYLCYSRPPSKVWMTDLPPDAFVDKYKPDKPWKPLGLIHTEDPISKSLLEKYELTPTKYM